MENTNTNIVTPTAKKRTGRKATNVQEILDKDFTIVDLVKINTSVKSPTIRAFVTRNVTTGRYTKVGTVKATGKRGKLALVSRVADKATA